MTSVKEGAFYMAGRMFIFDLMKIQGLKDNVWPGTKNDNASVPGTASGSGFCGQRFSQRYRGGALLDSMAPETALSFQDIK